MGGIPQGRPFKSLRTCNLGKLIVCLCTILQDPNARPHRMCPSCISMGRIVDVWVNIWTGSSQMEVRGLFAAATNTTFKTGEGPHPNQSAENLVWAELPATVAIQTRRTPVDARHGPHRKNTRPSTQDTQNICRSKKTRPLLHKPHTNVYARHDTLLHNTTHNVEALPSTQSHIVYTAHVKNILCRFVHNFWAGRPETTNGL
jgi:hypothetical protein